MAGPSPMSPLGHLFQRQTEAIAIKGRLFRERLLRAKNLYRKDLLAHYGCVNAIEFSDEGDLLVSGGDDRRVLLWSISDAINGGGNPICMEQTHISNIFCLAFDSKKSHIFSGGNDDQVIVHDLQTGRFSLKLRHRKPVYALSVNPKNDFIVATAGDDGRILLYDLRETDGSVSFITTEPLCLAKEKAGFHSVMFNPSQVQQIATANSEEGIALWDYRKPKERLIHYDSNAGAVSGISVCFNSTGSRLLALRRRLPPVLYGTETRNALCQFYHPHYYNSCTMKTCCFAGDNDEYVLSGSDDFNLYMWRLPNENCEWGHSHMVLRGHRSIVNQVRYNRHNNFIASSGVEKMIKLWSAMPIGGWNGALLKSHCETSRPVYSLDDYVFLVGQSGQRISHDYSDQSTLEDSRMMAFFDSLIQREIEGWDTPCDTTSTTDSDTEPRTPIPWHLLATRKYIDDTVNRKQPPNRITELIAEKRNILAKMAHGKASSSIRRFHIKQAKRKLRATKHRVVVKGGGANKMNGGRKSAGGKCTLRPASPSVAHARKEHPRSKSERCTRSKKHHHRAKQLPTAVTTPSSDSIDVPSTSTGITASNAAVFRVIEQDSDDDVQQQQQQQQQANERGHAPDDHESDRNYVNILPTPLNGSHDMCLNALSHSNGNVVTLSNDQYAEQTAATAASTSAAAARAKNVRFCELNDYRERERYYANDAYESYVEGAYIGGGGASGGGHALFRNDSGESTNSECSEYEQCATPVKRRRTLTVTTPDSGFATGGGACSSGSSCGRRAQRSAITPPTSSGKRGGGGAAAAYHDHSSDETDYRYEKFRKRVKKARLNLRRQIGADSDSN